MNFKPGDLAYHFNEPTYAGMRVVVDEKLDRVPRMVVSAAFAALMPPDFVADLNAWMLEFFGTRCEMYRIGDHTLMMGPTSFEQLRTFARHGGES